MKLYVCWNTNLRFMGNDAHPCGVAYEALRRAGHSPLVIKGRGWRVLPDALFNRSEPRQEVKQRTGRVDVPVLVTDQDEAIYPSRRIVEWAMQHPAGRPRPSEA